MAINMYCLYRLQQNYSIFNWSQAVWHWLLWPRYWTSNNCVKAFNLFYQERDNSAKGMWGGEKNQQPPATINKWIWIVTRRPFYLIFKVNAIEFALTLPWEHTSHYILRHDSWHLTKANIVKCSNTQGKLSKLFFLFWIDSFNCGKIKDMIL